MVMIVEENVPVKPQTRKTNPKYPRYVEKPKQTEPTAPQFIESAKKVPAPKPTAV